MRNAILRNHLKGIILFFVMDIYGAKFQEHYFNISRDIVYSGLTTFQLYFERPFK